ncbi:MAG: hypothetical protein LJE91_09020 [Gammaproteobacteria bacterium]|nr:hypothetical protein [Gammaproteobacteria bacterium]
MLSADGTQGSGTAVFEGSYSVSSFSDVFGIAFDTQWAQPADGGYVVFTVDASEDQDTQEAILVFDGKSMPTGPRPMSFNADISSADFFVYYVPAAKSDK